MISQRSRVLFRVFQKRKGITNIQNFFVILNFFYDKLNEHESDWVNKFSKTLLEKCQIIEIRSWQIEQSIAMFNSLNSTGMPLTDADIISAQLYSKSKDQNKLFEERWEYIKAQSEQLSQLQIVDIDSVLQEGMYVLRALKKEYKENEVTTPGIRRYYIEYHKELLERPFEICNLFEKILLTWDVIKEYPIIKLLLKFNINSKLFLISYLSRFDPADLTVDKVQPIAEMLIRLFAVNEVVDSGYSSTKFKTFLFNENLKLVDSRVGIDEILEDFNRHIRKSWDRENIKQSIVTYQKNALVYLNEYLFSMEKGKDFDFESEKINIEHIMPASGRNLDHIRLDANIQDKNEFEEYVNKIGNKILLEENINKSISNDWFRTKKGNTIKDKMGYLESKFCLAQELSNYHRDMWQKEDSDSATERAANRILDFIFE